MAKKYNQIAKILAIIGGALAAVEAVLSMAGAAFVGGGDFVGAGIFGSIIALLLGLVALFAALKPNDPIPWNGILILILGIVMIILASLIGGILVLIAGILLLV